MKYCFIINPKAGKGEFSRSLSGSIKNACESSGRNFDIFISHDVKETAEYIRRTAENSEEEIGFIACGGDGTLCRTVSSVMALDGEVRKNTAVGVIPVGTGNDFVSNFKNKERFLDIEAQLSPSFAAVDLLRCNEVYSVNMVNIGFDCHVVCRKEQIGHKKFVPKSMAYIFALVITLIKKPGVKFEFFRDGEPEEGKKDLLLTTLANGEYCGGGFHSNPRSSLTDGMIDCISVKNMSRLRFLSMVGNYKNGRHLNGKYDNLLSNFKCSTARMKFDRETPVSVDGEIIRTNELSVSVCHGALRFLLPSGVEPMNGGVTEQVKEEEKEKAGTAV